MNCTVSGEYRTIDKLAGIAEHAADGVLAFDAAPADDSRAYRS